MQSKRKHRAYRLLHAYRYLLFAIVLIFSLNACEDEPELSDGRYLAVSDIDRGDGWVAWLYAEIERGQVVHTRFDYIHRETKALYSEAGEQMNSVEPAELFAMYEQQFSEAPGPDFSIDVGPRSVSRHISALAIGVVRASIETLDQPVLVSAPGDGSAIDGEEIVPALPVDIPGTPTE